MYTCNDHMHMAVESLAVLQHMNQMIIIMAHFTSHQLSCWKNLLAKLN